MQTVFEKYRAILDALMGEGGCPWDREQTPETLRTCLLEETYEVIEAVNEGDAAHVKEELGDALNVIMMMSLVYEGRGDFSADDVIKGISDKLVRRHPHVFGDVAVKDSDEVLENWAKIKRDVEGRRDVHILDGVSKALPPLEASYKIQKKAAKKGFDWTNVRGVLDKLREETAEVEAELGAMEKNAGCNARLEEELGDLLFSVVNLCRFNKIDPSVSLLKANAKFVKRFSFVEERCAEKSVTMSKENIDTLETFWEEAKMKEKNEGVLFLESENALDEAAMKELTAQSIACCKPRRVLLIVPDFTRFHSNAGLIARLYYDALSSSSAVDLLVALGTHVPMTREECAVMYAGIPYERFIMHDFRNGNKKCGVLPRDFVRDVSGGLLDEDIEVEVDARLWDGYDLIVSIGQIVPHEVAGMAGHTKNIFVGVGGASMISGSHILGAFYGLERIMGRLDTPVRRLFDEAAARFLADLPILYALTVTQQDKKEPAKINTHGLFIGKGRGCLEKAASLAQKVNITLLEKPVQKIVVNLDEKEFRSTWLGNKAVYRTRMAIADGGELFVLAPGVDKFGEDAQIDALIRQYGYRGRENIIALCKEGGGSGSSLGSSSSLGANLSAAAHLIHGSADGRFSITYCTRLLSESDIRAVHYNYMPYDKAASRFSPASLHDGFNTLPNGESVYYISNPALGLWAVRGAL